MIKGKFVRKPVIDKIEALKIHNEALVIDTQQPPATNGFLFTDKMKKQLDLYKTQGISQGVAFLLLSAQAASEIQTSESARNQYLEFWQKSGVNIACGTYAGPGPIENSFEESVTNIAQARSMIDAMSDNMKLILNSKDIATIQSQNKIGLIIDFQNTTPFGDNLHRIDLFHNLGLRMCQLTYNNANLVGGGCTDMNKTGLTNFGKSVVERLNQLNIIVDVSHCSEEVGWDSMKISNSPVIVSHASSSSLCYHDRGKSDTFAKAIADQGGFLGVVTIPGFIQDTYTATLDDIADHIVHLTNVMGIDHVGIGTDKAGPGPGTDSMIEWPEGMANDRLSSVIPGQFNHTGFRLEEHRLTDEYKIIGYNDFRDWPNITIKLAERGFNETELRKILGLNYLRVFKEVVG